jgi:hypothetical protein
MRSAGICSWIFAVPMFEDFWITCATEMVPFGCESLMVQPPSVIGPVPVCTRVVGFTTPDSSAAATVKGFIVEPGSNTSVTERLRVCLPVTLARLFGL